MNVEVSSDGQITIPSTIRRELGIVAGDALEICVEDCRVVLKKTTEKKRTAGIIIDPLSGFPVLTLGGTNPPMIMQREVDKLLAEFP